VVAAEVGAVEDVYCFPVDGPRQEPCFRASGAVEGILQGLQPLEPFLRHVLLHEDDRLFPLVAETVDGDRGHIAGYLVGCSSVRRYAEARRDGQKLFWIGNAVVGVAAVGHRLEEKRHLPAMVGMG